MSTQIPPEKLQEQPLPPEEKREEMLRKRREYYRENRDRIRARDNASARRLRQENKERYQSYVTKFKENQREAAVYPDPAHYENYKRQKEMLEHGGICTEETSET